MHEEELERERAWVEHQEEQRRDEEILDEQEEMMNEMEWEERGRQEHAESCACM